MSLSKQFPLLSKRWYMRLLFLFSTLTILFFSCSKKEIDMKKKTEFAEQKSIHCQEVSKIAYSLEQELLDTEGYFGLCRAFMCDHEEGGKLNRTIVLEYYSQELLELEDARDLIVHMTEFVINKVNKHPFLFRTMPNAPIDASHLNIRVEFESFYGVYVDPLYVGRVELRDNVVHYYAFTALNCDTIVFERHIEDYTTARMITQVKQEVQMEHRALKVKPIRKRSRGPITPQLIKGPSFIKNL